MSQSKIILIAGPSGSGKSTIASALEKQLIALGKCSRSLALDSYYRDLRHLSPAERALQDFDEPDAWELPRILRDVSDLKTGKSTEIPIYDFRTHLRSAETCHVDPVDFVILEGLFALCYPELNELADFRIFVDLEDEIALQRRIERDTKTRGRTERSVIEQYQQTVQPANARFVRPSSKRADLILQGTDPLDLQLRRILPFLDTFGLLPPIHLLS